MACALVHAESHVDDVAPVIPGNQLSATHRAPLYEAAQLAIRVTVQGLGLRAEAYGRLCTPRLGSYMRWKRSTVMSGGTFWGAADAVDILSALLSLQIGWEL